ncbi:MAG: hypothetical protein GVY36_02900 [Verrucomicrobia bacterium]|jgi:L-fuculose-phosphate aldolase|nr:hypothetical protein [Verrucomicrobiota bacterium]
MNALPVNATAFSIGSTQLDTRTIPESYLFLRDVPTIPYREALTDPHAVARRLGPDHPVALLELNGALVAGKTCSTYLIVWKSLKRSFKAAR